MTVASALAQVQSGFWLGLGLALAVLVWGIVQIMIHRVEGH